jgi:hypothetical protein
LKHVVGISLGSAERDHVVTVELLGQTYKVERLGTDGDMKAMIDKITEMDGHVDAFGLGGMDLYIYAVDRRYEFRDARRIVRVAKKTPIVDGSGLKNTLERRAIEHLAAHTDLFDRPQKALLMCAMDRLGMAQALEKAGCMMTYGDFPFTLNLPIPIHSLNKLALVARVIAPIVCQLPFKMVYPTGEKQTESKPRYARYFEEAQIIAGDFHFIRRYMPPEIEGKIIITNTVTRDDIEFLKKSKAKTLITTTPEMDGRSFGTNVMEALLVCLAGGKKELSEDEHNRSLAELELIPRIVALN